MLASEKMSEIIVLRCKAQIFSEIVKAGFGGCECQTNHLALTCLFKHQERNYTMMQLQ
jgi:hypothetical protein